MPIPGKEVEPRLEMDQIAGREVESYIERTERQTESSAQAQTSTAITGQPPKAQQPGQDMGVVVSAQFAAVQKPKIVLPLNRAQIEEGLHHKIVDSVKWLAEWCVMMIKKYPGRVFYLPPGPLQQ